LKGKGVKNLKTKVPGNQYVHLLVQYPKKLTEEEREKIINIIEKREKKERVW